MSRVAVSITLGVLSVIIQASAKRNKQVYCGACIGLVQEMDWGMASTDSKKTLQVGSFRIDSDGRQALNQIPLKYSELHLTELLEGACNEVGRYAESQKQGSDKVNFIRTDSRDGKPISLKNIRLSTDTQRLLQFACETIVEEHEDSIISMYKSQESDVGMRLCVELTGFCNPENITDFHQAIDEMISEAAREEAERQREEALKASAVSEEHGENDGVQEDSSAAENKEQTDEGVESVGEKTKSEL